MKIHRKIRKSVHKGRVFQVFHDEITLPCGISSSVDIIDHPGASAIIPVTDDGHILMIRQYRYAIEEYILEIPAGTRSKEETFLLCAQRELTEETGYGAKQMEEIGKLTPVPGYSNERVILFLARDLFPLQSNPDADEIIEPLEIRMADAINLVFSGKIQDAKTVCGIILAAKRLGYAL